MPRSKSSKTLTLFLFIGLALALSVEASGHSPAMRRDHTGLKRMIRKRSPQTGSEENSPGGGLLGPGGSGPVIGAGKDEDLDSTSSVSSSSTSSSSSTTFPASSTSSSSSSVSSSSSTSSSASSSASSSSASSSSPTSQQPAVTPPPPPPSSQTQQSQAENVPTTNAPGLTITRTQTDEALPTAESNTNNTQSGSLSTTGKTIMTILIVLAVSAGACILLWTVVRKWTQKKDKRLQPIDWQPTDPKDDIIPPNRRLSGASFRSAGGYGATDGASSHHGHGGLNPIPDHDFTAGSTLAPVGGYADLHRGPSPGPQMSEGIHRGPSFSRPNFEAGVPLHHQAGYTSQDAYKY